MDKAKIKALLALNDEQKALLEEWNELAARMEQAEMWFVWSSFDRSYAVLNFKNIEDYDNDPFDLIEGMEEVDAKEFDWDNFVTPNFTELFDGESLYIKFKD